MNNRIVGVLGLALAFGIAGPAAAADVLWSGNGHYYRVVSSPGTISWDSANVAAVAAGGYLATITSQAENEFVFGLVNKADYWHGYSGPWLGGYQSPVTQQPAANWRWVTDEPWSYTHWQTGQPNDSGGKDENKLQFGFAPFTSSWNDIMSVDPVADYRPIAYVVEFVPEPSGAALLGLALACWLGRRQLHM